MLTLSLVAEEPPRSGDREVQPLDWEAIVPEEFRAKVQPAPDEENAYALWRNIDPSALVADFFEEEAIAEAHDFLSAPSDPSFGEYVASIDDETWPKLDAWLEARGELLEKIQRGAERPRLVVPSAELFAGDPTSVPRLAAQHRLARAMSALRRKHDARALAEVRAAQAIARRLGSRDGPLVLFMMSISLRSECTAALRRIVAAGRLTEEELRSIAVEGPDPEGFRAALQSEFGRYVVPPLRAISPADPIAGVLRMFFPANLLEGPLRDEIRTKLAHILDGHGAPFDSAATLRLALDRYREIIAILVDGRKAGPTTTALEAELGAWPSALRIESLIWHAVGDTEEKIDVTDRALEAAKRAMERVTNPLGKLVALDVMPLGDIVAYPGYLRSARLGAMATRVMIALRRYELREANLPATLEELVRAKLLPAVPVDPYTKKAIAYDRAGRRLEFSPLASDPEGEDGDEAKPLGWEF